MLFRFAQTLTAIIAMASVNAPAPHPEPATEPIRTNREKVLAVAKSAVGWVEATGKNDGPHIERILGSVGLAGTGAPYCAAFCVFCYQEAGVGGKIPHSAYSPDMVRQPTWRRGRGETPRPADVFGIWFPSKDRVAHAGLVEKWGNGTAVTIEANTNPQAEPGSELDRNGEGVYRRWRPTMTIFAVQSYL